MLATQPMNSSQQALQLLGGNKLRIWKVALRWKLTRNYLEKRDRMHLYHMTP